MYERNGRYEGCKKSGERSASDWGRMQSSVRSRDPTVYVAYQCQVSAFISNSAWKIGRPRVLSADSEVLMPDSETWRSVLVPVIQNFGTQEMLLG